MSEHLELPKSFDANDRKLFATGVKAFRSGDFFTAHDEWEEVWHGYRATDRRFLQGLIHVAVSAYHARNGNRRGATSQSGKARDKMGEFAPRHWGIDVNGLLELSERVAALSVETNDLAAAIDDLTRAL